MEKDGNRRNKELSRKNARYQALLERHQGLDDQIDQIEEGRDHLEDLELSRLKRERLYLKQQIEFLRYRMQTESR